MLKFWSKLVLNIVTRKNFTLKNFFVGLYLIFAVGWLKKLKKKTTTKYKVRVGDKNRPGIITFTVTNKISIKFLFYVELANYFFI